MVKLKYYIYDYSQTSSHSWFRTYAYVQRTVGGFCFVLAHKLPSSCGNKSALYNRQIPSLTH